MSTRAGCPQRRGVHRARFHCPCTVSQLIGFSMFSWFSLHQFCKLVNPTIYCPKSGYYTNKRESFNKHYKGCICSKRRVCEGIPLFQGHLSLFQESISRNIPSQNPIERINAQTCHSKHCFLIKQAHCFVWKGPGSLASAPHIVPLIGGP